MQKIAIGVLSVAVLALAANDARHRVRERLLEERLTAAERKPMPKPRPGPTERETPAPAAEPAAPATAPLAVAAPLPTPPPAAAQPLAAAELPVQVREFQVQATEALLTDALTLHGAVRASFAIAPYDGDLNLSDAQRSAIDRLREVQSAQNQEIEKAIRNLLTPDQQAKYDASRNGLQLNWVGQTASMPQFETEPKPGYLGVQGGDAAGGGAEVTGVLANTAASLSGLQTGDVILEVNGEPIPGLSALSQTIRKTGEGFAANLRIRRAGVEFIQGVQLGGASK